MRKGDRIDALFLCKPSRARASRDDARARLMMRWTDDVYAVVLTHAVRLVVSPRRRRVSKRRFSA